MTKFHMDILPLDNAYHSRNSYHVNPTSEETAYEQELTQINHSNEVITLIIANMQVTEANIWT
jgi:hypothetical protein